MGGVNVEGSVKQVASKVGRTDGRTDQSKGSKEARKATNTRKKMDAAALAREFGPLDPHVSQVILQLVIGYSCVLKLAVSTLVVSNILVSKSTCISSKYFSSIDSPSKYLHGVPVLT